MINQQTKNVLWGQYIGKKTDENKIKSVGMKYKTTQNKIDSPTNMPFSNKNSTNMHYKESADAQIPIKIPTFAP